MKENNIRIGDYIESQESLRKEYEKKMIGRDNKIKEIGIGIEEKDKEIVGLRNRENKYKERRDCNEG